MHLVAAYGWKPFEKLVHGGTCVEVFEQAGNGQSRAPEAPCPAELAR